MINTTKGWLWLMTQPSVLIQISSGAFPYPTWKYSSHLPSTLLLGVDGIDSGCGYVHHKNKDINKQSSLFLLCFPDCGCHPDCSNIQGSSKMLLSPWTVKKRLCVTWKSWCLRCLCSRHNQKATGKHIWETDSVDHSCFPLRVLFYVGSLMAMLTVSSLLNVCVRM